MRIKLIKPRFISLLFLMVVLHGCIESSKQNESTSFQILSIEQKAMNFIRDSILFKKIYSDQSVLKNDEINLIPHDIDSLWLTKGMFYGYKLYADTVCKTLSNPDHDSLTIIADKEYLTDSIIAETSEFINYININSYNLDTINLVLPEPFLGGSEKEFLARGSDKELFIMVGKKIMSKSSQMVEVIVLRNGGSVRGPLEYRISIYFDQNGNLTKWFFF